MANPSPAEIISAAIAAQALRDAVRLVPAVVPYLNDATIKAAGYDGIRTVMHGAVFGSVFGYLETGGSVAPFRERMVMAVSKAYLETADAAYQEAGAELPLDDDTANWARLELAAQLDYVDQLFETLKDLRKAGDYDSGEVAISRADSWASGLDGFYNEVVLRGSKNQMVEWVLGETEKHCPTCLSLNGKRHRISWFIERDYIPRKNGCALDCGGWNCDCSLIDKDGNEITL